MEGDDFLQKPSLGVSFLDSQLSDVSLGHDHLLISIAGIIDGIGVLVFISLGRGPVREDNVPSRSRELVFLIHVGLGMPGRS